MTTKPEQPAYDKGTLAIEPGVHSGFTIKQSNGTLLFAGQLRPCLDYILEHYGEDASGAFDVMSVATAPSMPSVEDLLRQAEPRAPTPYDLNDDIPF